MVIDRRSARVSVYLRVLFDVERWEYPLADLSLVRAKLLYRASSIHFKSEGIIAVLPDQCMVLASCERASDLDEYIALLTRELDIPLHPTLLRIAAKA